MDRDELRRMMEEANKAIEGAVERATEKANAPTWSDDVLGGAIEEERARKQTASKERFARICENSEAVTERASAEIELHERLEAAADKLATVTLSTEEAARWGAMLAGINAAIGRGDSNAAERLDDLEVAVKEARSKMLPRWMR